MSQRKPTPPKVSRIQSSLEGLPKGPVEPAFVDPATLPIWEQPLYLKLCNMLENPAADGHSFHVPIEYITLGRNNRGEIDENDPKFISLKTSIEKDGVIHNVTVFAEDGKPTLKAGFRRFKAMQMLGFEKVWITVKTKENVDGDLVQIYENILRDNLDPITYCEALKVIKIKEHISSLDQLAAKVGLKDRGLVGFYMKAADWPDEIKTLFKAEGLNRSHIHKIARLKESNDPEQLKKLIEHHAAIAKREKLKAEEGAGEPQKREGAEIDLELKKKINALIKARSDVPDEARARLKKMAVAYSGFSKEERKAFADIITKI